MKKLLMCLMISLMLGMSVDQSFPLSYEIDLGQDGSFETGGSVDLEVGESISIDIYVDDYFCAPDDNLFGVQTYITIDESRVDIDSCVPNAAGGCDPTLSGCTNPEEDVYNLVCSNFGFIPVVTGSHLLGTVQLDSVSEGETDLVVADDQTAFGYPAFDDGFLSDCNLDSHYPTAAVLGINKLANTTTSIKDSSSTTSSPSTTSTSDSSTTTTSNGPSSSSTTSSALTTTTSTSSGPCLFESLYGDNAEETVRARYFRDDVLSASAEGREIIGLYYVWSPLIVEAMERDSQLQSDIHMMLDQFNSFFGEMP